MPVYTSTVFDLVGVKVTSNDVLMLIPRAVGAKWPALIFLVRATLITPVHSNLKTFLFQFMGAATTVTGGYLSVW